MNSPKVSVIMGVYNGEKHVQQAVLSVLSQSFEDFEFIVVNDGSTDNTLQVLQAIQDPRLQIFTTENQGLTKSLNFALSKARGKFIARQDADDVSLVNRFEKQLCMFNTDKELCMIGSSMYISNPKGLFNEIFYYPTDDQTIKNVVAHYNPFVHGSVMFKKSEIVREGGYNESFRYVQDYELWSRIIPKYKCLNLNEPLYARLRGGDCSEVSVDKSEFVEKIQQKLRQNTNLGEASNNQTITAKSIYPYIGWPLKQCSALATTFKAIGTLAKANQLESKNYLTKARCYYPWSFFE